MPDTMTIYSESPDADTLGGRLSRARDASGLSEIQLASRLGVRISTVRGWESDRAQPRASRLSMLAGILNVSPSWLLHGVGSGPLHSEDDDSLSHILKRMEKLKRLNRETTRIISEIERELGRAISAR